MKNNGMKNIAVMVICMMLSFLPIPVFADAATEVTFPEDAIYLSFLVLFLICPL